MLISFSTWKRKSTERKWIYVCNPCCFFMFNSFLFGVVSFPFQNIQVQQRKKKYCSMQLFSIARKRQNPKLIGTPNGLYREKNEASLKTWRNWGEESAGWTNLQAFYLYEKVQGLSDITFPLYITGLILFRPIKNVVDNSN